MTTSPTFDVPVVVHHDPSLRTTSLCFALGFGGRHDPPGRAGAAHMLEHLLMSAPLGDGPSLSERIEDRGGESNAMTGPESLVIHAQVLTEDAADVATWMCRALLEPHWDRGNFDSERDVVLQELAAADSDDADAVQDAFFARLFDGHPLGSPVGGRPETVSGLTLESVRDAHALALRTAPLAVAVAGGLPEDTLREALRRGGLGRVACNPVPDPLLGSLGGVPAPPVPGAVEKWPDAFCWLLAGGRAPHAGDPRRHAYTVLAHLLGGSPASPLYARLRNQEALAYDFRSWSRSYSDSGAWRMLAGCEPDNAPRLLDAFREVLRGVADDGPRERDFAAAVRRATVEAVREAEAPLDRTIAVATQRILSDRIWDAETEIEALARVSAADVALAARELSDSLITVVRPEQR
ncbi:MULTISPECIES: pitrilysin family protein [unclassified Streptomyces]|uniref:M16 family metallopeptidase n=1 Tax=unclassified Streptomyces TaxID=2593676 RepID=UPI002F91288D